MIYADKWRENIINPKEVIFLCGMKVIEILGYPHAGNDVFACIIEFKGKRYKSVLKIERHIEGNLENEWNTINKLKESGLKLPNIITYGCIENHRYIVTEFIDGQRISQLIKGCDTNKIVEKSLKYMYKFGENLGRIHKININGQEVTNRKFHYPMDINKSKRIGLEEVSEWLDNNRPIGGTSCFIHGDYHYANVLWRDYKISGILDWELSGNGWKEFDLAWTLILRPSQTFMKTKKERQTFLKGYRVHQDFNYDHLIYCMVMIYQYFYKIGKKIKDYHYIRFIKSEFSRLIGKKI